MLIKLNSNGEDVKKLQIKLGLTPDGVFGKNTELKVKEWQTANGLKADGIVGDITWTKLFQVKTTTPEVVVNNNIKLENIRSIIPAHVMLEIPSIIIKYNLNKLKLAHFLSQCSHESGGFKVVSENLNYTTDRMLEIFKYDFDINHDKVLSINEKKKAELLKGSPEKIANFVYANQNGNGNELSGDGWKFRGRGYIQLTGRLNYTEFDKTVDDDILTNPDLVATKYPLQSAAFFFTKNNLWLLCDSDSTECIKKLTKRINGGYNGLDDRITKFNQIYKLL